jgi:hypothetical protein
VYRYVKSRDAQAGEPPATAIGSMHAASTSIYIYCILRYTIIRTIADSQDDLNRYQAISIGRVVDMSSNRSDNRLSAPTSSDSTKSLEMVWRFEPSAASEAVWANDLLVEMIYRHVYQQGYMEHLGNVQGLRDMINGMLLCKTRFWTIARIRYEESSYDDILDLFYAGASLVSSRLPYRTTRKLLSPKSTGSLRGHLPKCKGSTRASRSPLSKHQRVRIRCQP